MWDFEGFYAKAKTYFDRSTGHSGSDEFGIWLLLGLEHLLRAPLAARHASLLASPDGDSVLSANGVPTKDPKSIPVTSVIRRLPFLIEDFGPDRQDDAHLLMNLRNSELHTSASAIASVDQRDWLPRFTRIVEVLCAHLGVAPETLVDPAILEVGRSLIDAEDKKVSHHVRQKLATARIVLEALTEEERLARTAVLRDVEETVDCPVCGTPLPPRVRFVRMTEERLGGDGLVHDLIYVIDGIDCPVCTVRLDGTAEVHAAGLPQLVTLTSETSFAERYMQDAADWEYGND